MTSGMIEAASRHAIDVVWLHDDGAFCSRLHHIYDGDVTLRRAQYTHTGQPATALRLARDIVTGKINNMQAHLRRAAARGVDGLTDIADRLDQARTELPQRQTLDQLRGSEGRATRDYFTGLALIVGDHWPFPAANAAHHSIRSTPCSRSATPCSPTRRSPHVKSPASIPTPARCTPTAPAGPASRWT
jgi:CRISPR-associated protein Cas1